MSKCLENRAFTSMCITKLRAISSISPNGSSNEHVFRKFHLDAEAAG
jgi:hypothetical protein